MRSRVAPLALVLSALALAGEVLAQEARLESFIGRVITGVTIEADGVPLATADVVALVETRAGEPLAMADVRESVLHLASVGRFDRVEVEGLTNGPDRVALVYRLVETRRITGIEIRGNLEVSGRRLRQAIGSRALGAATPDRVQSAERAARAFYESLGYFDVRITSAIEDRPEPSRARLVLTVEPGPRWRIGQLQVAPGANLPPDILARLRLVAGEPWDAPALEARSQRVAADLREDGHYEAAIAWTLDRRDDARLLDVTVEGSTGPLVELVFDSPDVPERRLRELVPVAEEGAVDEDLLEDSKRRIESWLHRQGYARATVEYARETLADRRLRITFTVRRGPVFHVERLDITGVDPSRLQEVTAIVDAKPGAPYSAEAMSLAVATVTELYRSRGFVSARVDTALAEVSQLGETHLVRPRLIVIEGEATGVGRIVLNGSASLPEGQLRGVMALKPGAPFYAPRILADRGAVASLYANRGFLDARVDVVPRASEAPHILDLHYEITEGRQYVVGHVLVAGNTRTSVDTITRELELSAGAPLGAEVLAAAQGRLNRLGLFRRVSVEGLPQPGRLITDVAVTVEEAPATNIGYGIGLEGGRRLVRESETSDTAVEKFEIWPRGFFEIGRRNLWGKNRSVNFYTRFSLRDRGGGSEPSEDDTSAFYEFRVVGTYREPRLFDTSADAQVNGFVEQGVRSSFNFARQGVNAEAARRLRNVTVLGRYSFGKTRLFDQRVAPEEEPLVDRLFPQVRLSTVSGVVVQDMRDDPLDPTRGHVANMELDLSARALGSEVGFLKGFAQAFFYRRVPGLAGTVFATGARLGLATAFGLVVETEEGSEEVKDLPASERFYAGGSTTVRGYALDRLGDDETIDSDGFPQGGNAMIVVNAELRFPVWRSVGGVVFMDAGNVFARVSDFGAIKPSIGSGVRYRSPIGPIRFDVGFKLDPRRFDDGREEGRWEVHISLGQAF